MPGHTAQAGLLRAIIVWHANREERPAAQLADRTNAACAVVTGRYVKASTAARHPRTTVTERD
jgi:hypothetical protein